MTVQGDTDGELLGIAVHRGRRRAALLTLAAAVVAVGGFVTLLVTAKRPIERSVLPGRPAPGLERSFSTLSGSELKVGDLRGKYIVLNFFASWCVPCEQEHPELIRFQQRHAAAGDATVVQVLFNDRPSAARQFAADRGDGGWPVLIDSAGRLALDYGVTGPPETYLINRQGIVLSAFKGAATADLLDGLLARAKQGPTR